MSYETPAAHFIWNPLGSFDCILKAASIFGVRCALHEALDRATTKENEDGGWKEVCDRCTGERAGEAVCEILNLNCEAQLNIVPFWQHKQCDAQFLRFFLSF